MNKNLLTSYEKFKHESYELSSVEFEIMQAKLKLVSSLNDKQLKYFEEYDKLTLLLLSKKEHHFLKFAIEQLKKQQK